VLALLAVSFSQIILYFTFYSVAGWLGESAWCSARSRRLVNRGFLAGPCCPVYGLGALAVLAVAGSVKAYPAVVFLAAAVAAAVLEYATGWFLETVFRSRWWDYSDRRFNLRGRTCLAHALVFGALGLAAVYVAQPVVAPAVAGLGAQTQQVAAGVALALMAFDLTYTLVSWTGLLERAEGLKAVRDELGQASRPRVEFDAADLSLSLPRLRAAVAAGGAAEARLSPVLEKAEGLRRRYGSGLRLMRAFPGLQPRRLGQEFDALRRAWDAQPRTAAQAARRRLSGWPGKARTEMAAAYRGVDATQLIWVFVIGNVVGYVVETVYCVVVHGVLESRQGLLYGPFSPVYGFGAVLMTLALAPLASKGNLWLFGGSAVVGGAFETACSLLQESLFGSVSWEYSGEPFALFGGRTGLVYMFWWGILGLVYMRLIHPRLVHLTERLPGRARRFFTAVIAVALAADMLLSAVAVARWGERVQGIGPGNRIGQLLDKHYPDDVMAQIYPNMQFTAVR
jgi:uncharacterized membrane protein